MFNIKKSDFTARNENLRDEKNILQDKETTNSYRIKSEEFLEDINFDNGDLEEKDIHNKKKSIYSCPIYCEREGSYLSESGAQRFPT